MPRLTNSTSRRAYRSGFYVLANGIGRLSAWEARVQLPPQIVVTERILADTKGISLNPDSDEWIVGTGSGRELTGKAPVLLATYEAVATEALEPGAAITIAALEPARSSLGGSYPAWVDCSAAEPRLVAFDTRGAAIALTPRETHGP